MSFRSIKLPLFSVLLLWLLAAIPLTAMAQSDGASTEAKPRIVAVNDTHDFGEVAEGAKVTHTFTIRNEGDAELRIIGAKGT